MLSGDAARAALQNHAASEDEQRRGIRVRKRLAPRLATDAVEALADNRRAWRPVAERLDELSLPKREKVLLALSPELGAALARWWEWSAHQPYQHGWDDVLTGRRTAATPSGRAGRSSAPTCATRSSTPGRQPT